MVRLLNFNDGFDQFISAQSQKIVISHAIRYASTASAPLATYVL
ncbi:hypothetical protein RBSH_00379 [Rhodopirellula baltica SH28]|uniref:Uncharacterized protein n=1 Tax=Rhodopirellula baltica SH28 TaxID=993517 RepID=K5DCA2_RHOBT|nr:hypothetical protein RBSH_00379 [Rhodopirellula baltica SH28]